MHNTSKVEIFSIICIQFVSCYEIKMINHCAWFVIISYGSFQQLTNFLNRLKNNACSKTETK